MRRHSALLVLAVALIGSEGWTQPPRTSIDLELRDRPAEEAIRLVSAKCDVSFLHDTSFDPRSLVNLDLRDVDALAALQAVAGQLGLEARGGRLICLQARSQGELFGTGLEGWSPDSPQGDAGSVALEFLAVPLRDVWAVTCRITGTAAVLSPRLGNELVTVHARNIPWTELIDASTRLSGMAAVYDSDVLRILSPEQREAERIHWEGLPSLGQHSWPDLEMDSEVLAERLRQAPAREILAFLRECAPGVPLIFDSDLEELGQLVKVHFLRVSSESLFLALVRTIGLVAYGTKEGIVICTPEEAPPSEARAELRARIEAERARRAARAAKHSETGAAQGGGQPVPPELARGYSLLEEFPAPPWGEARYRQLRRYQLTRARKLTVEEQRFVESYVSAWKPAFDHRSATEEPAGSGGEK